MAEKVIVNEQFSLQWRDVAKSWVMVVILPLLQSIVELIRANGSLQGIDWNNIVTSTVLATAIFLVQRFTQPPKVITTYDSNAQAAKVGEEVTEKVNSGKDV